MSKPRPDSISTKTLKRQTGCGHAYLTVSQPEEEYKEIFCILGKTGGCAAAFMSSLTRVITVALNCGAPLDKIVKQLVGTRCPNDGAGIASCPQVVADVLKEVFMHHEPAPTWPEK